MSAKRIIASGNERKQKGNEMEKLSLKHFKTPQLNGRTVYREQLPDGSVKLWEKVSSGEMYELVPDDSELDATDGAHPAWWRGRDHAVNVLCQKINEILDGKDNGEGVSSEPWESTRRKLLNAAYLVHRLEKAEKEIYAGRKNPN